MSAMLESVEPFQRRRFWPTDIPLLSAVESLDTDKPLVEFRAPHRNTTYHLYSVATNEIATLCTAAIWAWGSDPETGNFVPRNETAPVGLPEYRTQRVPNFRCEISYAFDTSTDKHIYHSGSRLESLLKADTSFNNNKRHRRKWQDPESTEEHKSFILTSSVFAQSNPYTQVREAQYTIHPWVYTATKDSYTWSPNPDRPTIMTFDSGRLCPISENEPSQLESGDIVWLSFSLSVSIGRRDWGPKYQPIEIVRMGHVQPPPIAPLAEQIIEKDNKRLRPGRVELLSDESPPTKRFKVDETDSPLKGPINNQSSRESDPPTATQSQDTRTIEEDLSKESGTENLHVAEPDVPSPTSNTTVAQVGRPIIQSADPEIDISHHDTGQTTTVTGPSDEVNISELPDERYNITVSKKGIRRARK